VADVVRTLGLGPVVLVGHDRGARVAHRFALDHPALLSHLVLLDIAPTYDVFMTLDHAGARARSHWFFHHVPDLPEALTAGREAGPAGRRYAGRLEGAVRVHGRRPRGAGLGPLHPRGAAAGGGRRGPRVRGRGGVASDADDERDRPVDRA